MMLVKYIAIVVGMFVAKTLIWLYWRANIQPEFVARGCDPIEYQRRRNSGWFFSVGTIVLITLYLVYVIAVPQAGQSVEEQLAFFFLLIVSISLNFLGTGGGIRYLKEKNVNVTPFGKVVLVFEDAAYVIGMVALYYVSTRESLLM